MSLPTDPKERKNMPICTGVLDYFKDALAEVARVSLVGNRQHNGDEPMHWAKEKSTDEADALVRHLLERGTLDTDGIRHSAKVAWRALALLQREIDAEQAHVIRPGEEVGRGESEGLDHIPEDYEVLRKLYTELLVEDGSDFTELGRYYETR